MTEINCIEYEIDTSWNFWRQILSERGVKHLLSVSKHNKKFYNSWTASLVQSQ